MRVVLIRHIILEIANVADISILSRNLQKVHPDLSALYDPICEALEFFKYIRNKYIAHFVPDLSDKIFEWQPFSYNLLGRLDIGSHNVVSMFALETVINTYCDGENGHKIFDSEIDLSYPPDLTRFLDYVGVSTIGALSYIVRLIEISRSYVDAPDMETDWLQLAIKAGETDFKYLRKLKR